MSGCTSARCVVLVAFGLMATAQAQDEIIYQRASAYNNIVVTQDGFGLRTLRFSPGGTRQSVVKIGDPDHLELPYARAMPVALAVVDDPQRVLIVGLGGGTIPNFLHKHFPQLQIDVVDIDPGVVEVARKFFGFREDDRLRAVVDDGRRFIELAKQPYDIIFLDAFDSENIPYSLATQEFLQAVRQALTPHGVVVANIWSRASNPMHDSMMRTYQQVFPNLYLMEVRGAGNEIVVGLCHEQRLDRSEIARQARRISQAGQFRFDMGELVEYGWQYVGEKSFNGQVLQDRDKLQKAG